MHKRDSVHVKELVAGQEKIKNQAGYQNNFHTVPLGLC